MIEITVFEIFSQIASALVVIGVFSSVIWFVWKQKSREKLLRDYEQYSKLMKIEREKQDSTMFALTLEKEKTPVVKNLKNPLHVWMDED